MKYYFLILALGFSLLTSTLVAQTVPVYVQKKVAISYRPLPPSTVTTLDLTDVEDYGPFVVAQIPASASSTFAGRARALDLIGSPRPEFAEIRTRDFRVPGTATAAPDLSPSLQLADYSGLTGLYILQFVAPARPGWLTSLKAAGVRVIGPGWLPSSALADLAGKDFTLVVG